ncbi:hypothetical protein [Maritimibacter sp. UBA3975]|uniref:hypothetical protein n=1 Tax=Maritimibacter sp. UBA3975 TaxID=1946833 RepID=UPI000C0B9CED|nr:hypothetical protein [Maritimibacter sp. UBA3975]MAM63140.1 hypothetical protein [Maritimibacter sp.]|tara:strand:- start:2484 stop:3152 length:669 start_codon:yes stop_codon:yes gene_type:complete
MFNYDPSAFRTALAEEGYVHLKGLLSDDFVRGLQDLFDAALTGGDTESAEWRISKKKRQFVFDFPSTEAAETFRTGMAALTGIPAGDLTISERHIKLYEPEADPYPAPHKDRAASFYSIGLPIRLSEGSSVCVFPDLDPGPNTEERAVFLEPAEGQAPADLYSSDDARILNEQVGDVIVFLGSGLYHERMKAAGTAVLYIKVNGEGDDPLGENIYARDNVTA